jgi:hypothetical protein
VCNLGVIGIGLGGLNNASHPNPLKRSTHKPGVRVCTPPRMPARQPGR